MSCKEKWKLKELKLLEGKQRNYGHSISDANKNQKLFYLRAKLGRMEFQFFHDFRYISVSAFLKSI